MMLSTTAGPAGALTPGWVVRSPEGRVDVVVLGEVDWSSQRELAALIATAWTEHPVRLVIDLHGVTFLSLSALRVLVSARNWARARDTTFEVVGADHTVRRTLRHLEDIP